MWELGFLRFMGIKIFMEIVIFKILSMNYQIFMNSQNITIPIPNSCVTNLS